MPAKPKKKTTKAKKPVKRTRSQIGKSSKRKGSEFERQIASELREIFPTAKRGIGQMRSASEVADVDGIPFWLECKAHKRVNIPAAIRQAIDANAKQRDEKRKKGLVPSVLPVLAVTKNDREAVLATMLWDDFKLLVEELNECRLLLADERSKV